MSKSKRESKDKKKKFISDAKMQYKGEQKLIEPKNNTLDRRMSQDDEQYVH